jgi:hypothetical protein
MIGMTTTAPKDAPHHQQLKLPDLNKSTIYRRHEARLATSYANKDDPRPALIRVLGGLPGFSKVILPYNKDVASINNNNNNNNNNTTATATFDTPILGTYSEETLFTTTTTPNRKAVTSSSSSSMNSATSSNTVKAMQAVLAAGLASGVAETLFGSHHAAKTWTPFSNTSTATTTSTPHPNNLPRVFATTLHPTTDGSLSLFVTSTRSSKSLMPIPQRVSSTAAAAARPLLLMSVASTSLLFGSQTFLQTLLKKNGNNNDESSMTIISTMVSSGIAGALVGGVQGAMFGKWQTAPQPQQRMAHPLQPLVLRSSTVRMPASIIQTMTHASISAIVLFTTFEHVQQRISSSSSLMATAGSGAIAGVASTLVTSQLASNTNTNPNITARLIPTLLRSAPKYALFFSGYQLLLHAVQS